MTACKPLLVAVALLVSTAAAAQKTKLAVLPTQFDETSAGLVPKLFDDYLLAAVQNAGDYEVIGQDDINAMLGFEQQKSLLGCDDASCIADIGGALGVDKIVVIKIARLGEDWVTTCKLISIRETRVEARTSDFVRGDVKNLLQAVPSIVGKLFGVAPASGSAAAPKLDAPAAQPPAAAGASTAGAALSAPDPSIGRGARVVGMIMAIGGWGVAALGALVSAVGLSCDNDYYTESIECEPRYGAVVAGQLLLGGGLVASGLGTGFYLNGKARSYTGDLEASGRHRLRWLGWVLTGVAAAAPFALTGAELPEAAVLAGLGAAAGAGVIFGVSMGSSSAYGVTKSGQKVPLAGVSLLREGDTLAPRLTFAWAY